MFKVTTTLPKTPYESKFEFIETRDEFEDQRSLNGWKFYGKIWANEESNFKTCIRLDWAECGWLKVCFAGGPDSYLVLPHYWDPDDLEGMNIFHYVHTLIDKVDTDKVVELDFEEEEGFRW